MEENEMYDWEMVEYTYDIPDDDEDKKRSKLGWVLDKGLSLGKKAVITGVVVSSIPILVPPLVVVSALGCALSLPFGFVFASYACTDKLMSKLFPDSSPPPPLSLGYDYHEEIYDQQQEEEEEEEGEDKRMEAVKDDVETRIELVDDSELEKVRVGDELIIENEEKPSFDLVGPGAANTNYAEQTDDRRVAAAPEDRKFQGQDGNLEVENDNKLIESEGRRGKVTEKAEKVVEKFTTPPPNKVEGSKGKNVHYSKDIEKKGKRKGLGALKFHGKKKELIRDEKTDQEKLLPGPVGDDKAVVQERIRGVSSDDKEQASEQGGIMLGTELNNDAKRVLAESHGEQIVGNVKDVNVVASSEVVADVIDKKIELRSVTIYSDPAGETYNQARIVADDVELKYDKDNLAEEVKKEKDVCVVDGGAHSDKGLFGGDEKIWKKMEAIRAIVGYKGPKGDSYVEELKALYLFTGIEPPPDSADFHNKLCFLMSVIGLK